MQSEHKDSFRTDSLHSEGDFALRCCDNNNSRGPVVHRTNYECVKVRLAYLGINLVHQSVTTFIEVRITQLTPRYMKVASRLFNLGVLPDEP